jgi:hypothetical protein
MHEPLTIDDQLRALEPLTPGSVAQLAGYRNQQTIRVQRMRGKALSPERLAKLAENLRLLADAADGLARDIIRDDLAKVEAMVVFDDAP